MPNLKDALRRWMPLAVTAVAVCFVCAAPCLAQSIFEDAATKGKTIAVNVGGSIAVIAVIWIVFRLWRDHFHLWDVIPLVVGILLLIFPVQIINMFKGWAS